MRNWQQFVIPYTSTIYDAIVLLELNQCVVVVDEAGRLFGTVTDRDIRKALLHNYRIPDQISQIVNTSPTSLHYPLSPKIARKVLQEKHFEQYPLLNEENVVCGIYTGQEISQLKLPNSVVLMAGGTGSRLAPMTDHCPKPLLPIGNRPVLETLLIELIQAGFEHFWISVNYRAEMIEEYFGDGERWGVEVQYLREKSALGTAGALSLLPDIPKTPILVMNGDLLTKVNYTKLLEFHEYHQVQMTMGVREYDLQVPYGVVRLEDVHVAKLDEKPIQWFFVNAGVYVLEPGLIGKIPQSAFNMTDLLDQLIPQREVVAFPIHEYWIDIGKNEDFLRAQAEYSTIFER
jgi:dTDP-glucose pyrophosphorylase